jgi:hypothetical protein
MQEAQQYGMVTDADFPMDQQFNQPTYKALFDRAFQCSTMDTVAFSNGDIVYVRDLPETITFVQQALRELKHGNASQFLVVGERLNSGAGVGQFTGQWQEQVYKMAQLAQSFQENAEDYFVLSRSLWRAIRDHVPDLIVGGVAFDNWFVSKAISLGHFVVDSTHSITALHLDHGDHKGSHAKPKSRYNTKLAASHGGWSFGHVSHCPWFTYRNPLNGALVLWKRRGKLVHS